MHNKSTLRSKKEKGLEIPDLLSLIYNTEPPADVQAIPVMVKVMTERHLIEADEVRIPTPPAGMCLDFDAMEDDESGEDAPVLFLPQNDEEEDEPEGEKSPVRVELVTDGELRVGSTVDLSWRECSGTGGAVISESVSFDRSAPEIVTLKRKHANLSSAVLDLIVNMQSPPIVFVLERGRRHVCVCGKPGGGSTEFTVRTFRIENSLLRRGVMLLDYSVEIHGVRVEKTHMVIKIRRAGSEDMP